MLSRAQFIRNVLGGGALLAGYSALLHGALPAPIHKPIIVPKDRKVRLAIVGVGFRGHEQIVEYSRIANVEIVAFADVSKKHSKANCEKFPQVPFFEDYREMLTKMGDQIDAVSIATPDFTHFNIAMMSMFYGKHVYVEKPLTHTIEEARIIARAAEHFGVVNQMGNQGQSGVGMLTFNKWVEEGIIPYPTKVTGWFNESNRRWYSWGKVDGYPKGSPVPKDLNWDLWLNKAAYHNYDPKLEPGNWRAWFDFGCGVLGDWGAHLLDAVYMNFDLGLPYEIKSELTDKSDYIFPKAAKLTFLFNGGDHQHPMQIDWYEGVNNLPPFDPELTDIKNPGYLMECPGIMFKGESHGKAVSILPKEKFLEMRPTLPRVTGKASNHFQNFVNACQGTEKTRSPFSKAAKLTEVFLLGCIAQRYEGTLKYDAENMRITNHPEADKMIRNYKPREGWNEFYKC